MKNLLITMLMFLLMVSAVNAMQGEGQSSNATPTAEVATTKPTKRRGPVFRATSDQIKQAQKILKERGLYAGEETGKLDKDTRAGLKKYQTAESIKATGTLNAITLEKMNIQLTDKQKAMVAKN
jgi:peptidoglycan hydrolase-like protein with peptidoglycan-binding domain